MIITYDDKSKLCYVDNKVNKTCCVCLETPNKVYCCDKCKDGVVCKDCHRQTAKLENLEDIILFTYRCPICRDFVGEDLDEELTRKYELDDKFILGKMLKLNRENINNYHNRYREEESGDEYRSEEDEDDTELYEDWNYYREQLINDDLMATLPSIHGLTGEDRERQANRQARHIDTINNVYYINDLFTTYLT